MKPILGKLESIELRRVWPDEARDFTPWLAEEENLTALSSELGMELELEGVEVPVGSYYADIVAMDLSSNKRVIIENQLEKTNHDHLGKTLTYASGLNANIVIWIAREFTEEHRQAVDFLNNNAAPNLSFFAIEIRVLQIGDSLPAPNFKLVASPNNYATTVKTESSDLSDTKVLYLNFWTAFKDYCQTRGTFLSLRTPRPQHWFSIAVGRSKFTMHLLVSKMYKHIACEIYIRGEQAKQAFKLLEAQKLVIEQQLGPLEWEELPDGQDSRIVLYKKPIDVSDKTTWNEAHEWLISQAEMFHKSFSPIIKQLQLSDYGEVATEMELPV